MKLHFGAVLNVLALLLHDPVDAMYKGDVRLLDTLDAVDVYGRRVGCNSGGQAIGIMAATFVAFNLNHPRRTFFGIRRVHSFILTNYLSDNLLVWYFLVQETTKIFTNIPFIFICRTF